MNYQQTLEYLFSQLPMYQRVGKAAYKADLNNTLALDKYFSHPHKQFRSIHIAGTNGKGSTSHMLCSILMEAGYKVGLYTSPHLLDFRERIKINGNAISEKEVITFVAANKQVFEEIKPSFFEMTVALAFKYFADQKVDIAVVEVGLGGRLDSTNIVEPDLSIITNIGLDHTDLLGDTLRKIAIEKAGIIKPNTPVVISELQEEIQDIFLNKAKVCNAPLTFASTNFVIKKSTMKSGCQDLDIRNVKQGQTTKYKLDMLGHYQGKNIAGVLASTEILAMLGYEISKSHISKGLENVIRNTGIMGRWQIIGRNPLVICDTGHNLDGISVIVSQISSTPHKNLHMVIGMVGDKNIDGVLQILPKNARYYFTRPSIPRGLDEKILAEKGKLVQLKGNEYPNVKNAIEAATSMASPDDLIFIGGSTFTVADALAK
jgi:dihydrofolate synthase/folylpolyglutamate synthase